MANVISVCNAGKKWHGEKHWYWAVWIKVDHKQWNDQVPEVSGFAESKSKARRAAWETLSATGHRRAYCIGWANRWLRSLRERDTRPLFSRFSLGKNRWYWVTGAFMEEPIATGVASSPETALHDAEHQVGSVCPTGNYLAKGHWQKQQAIQRSKKQAPGSTASPLEFVYECRRTWSDYDDSIHDSISKYRIVKRTKKRIYVDTKEYRENLEPTGEWEDWVETTFTLDRQEFETTGKANRPSRGWWTGTYYASPEVYFAEHRYDSRPECFVTLGIDANATEKQVKAAYRRLAKETHPDNGGDCEQFKGIRTAYEQAMAIAAQEDVA